jgi:hypothetical protein
MNMTHTSLLELHASGSWGRYSPHCFFIRASIEADLEPASGIPSKNAVAIHAHEYVHMLHNVSTCAGLHLFLANTWLLRSLPHATDGDGHFRGPDFLFEPERIRVRQSYDWLTALLGGIKWRYSADGPPDVASWKFEAVKSGRHVVVVPPQAFPVELISLDGQAIQKDGTSHPFSLAVGYHFITEGVAYEVEREIRRGVGIAEHLLDAGTPPHPYLMFGKLMDDWVGRETTPAERIDLGVYALRDTSPGRALWDLTQSLRQHAPQPAADGRVPAVVMQNFSAGLNADLLDFFRLSIAPEIAQLGRTPAVKQAAAELSGLFETALVLRTKEPVLERTLLGCRDKDSYRQCVAQLVDCFVLQTKASGIVDNMWIGPGIVARTTASAENLVRIQTAMHFAQRHFHPAHGLQSTAQLGKMTCPFSGGCKLESDEDFPLVCSTRPWDRFPGSKQGEPVCWYAGGVKALARARYPGRLI